MLLGNESLGQGPLGTGTFTATTSVAATRSISWKVRKTIASTRSLSWKVRKVVSLTRSASWNTRKAISSNRIVSWGARQAVAATRQVSWGVLRIVSATRNVVWGAQKAISATRTIIWNDLMTEPPAITLTGNDSLKQHDFGMRLQYSLTFNGAAVNLTGRDVYFSMKYPDACFSVKELATVTDAVTGTVYYRVENGDLVNAGLHKIEFEVHYPDGSILTIPNDSKLFLTVVPDLG